MPEKTGTKTSRVGWLAMHGGFLVWGLCLMVLAEDHRDGNNSTHRSVEPAAAVAEKSAGSESHAAQAWVKKRINALRDPVYGVRAKATQQLLAAGSAVVKPLAAALDSKNPEVRRRAEFILARLIRGDEECFAELENVACSGSDVVAKAAAVLLQQECHRREYLMAAMAEQRKVEAHRYLREARAALYQGELIRARRKALAAAALDVTYNLFDDSPALVLAAIEKAELRLAVKPSAPALVTAERE